MTATYLRGETAYIPAVFTDANKVETAVPDSSISILLNSTVVLAPTSMTHIGGGRYIYSYTIPGGATYGTYQAYLQGTVGGNLQTILYEFVVSDKHTQVMDAIADVKGDVQSSQTAIQQDIADVKADIGVGLGGTPIAQQLADIQEDIGDPSLGGESLSSKLDDVKIALGLGIVLGTVQVTGTVLNPVGAPIPGVRVIAYSVPTGVAVNTATTDASGNFSMYLNPGSYTLEFFEECTVLKTTIAITVPINVVTYPLGNVTLTVKKTVTDKVMSGTPAVAVEGVIVKAYLESTYDPAIDNPVEGIAITGSDGVFTMQLFPGTYILEFSRTGYAPLSEERQVF